VLVCACLWLSVTNPDGGRPNRLTHNSANADWVGFFVRHTAPANRNPRIFLSAFHTCSGMWIGALSKATRSARACTRERPTRRSRVRRSGLSCPDRNPRPSHRRPWREKLAEACSAIANNRSQENRGDYLRVLKAFADLVEGQEAGSMARGGG
jgi:hypothetical protein